MEQDMASDSMLFTKKPKQAVILIETLQCPNCRHDLTHLNFATSGLLTCNNPRCSFKIKARVKVYKEFTKEVRKMLYDYGLRL